MASYETTPKWHGFLMNKLAAFQAIGGARMKQRLAGTVNRLNVEHRTSNIERPILMTLRFIDFKTNEPQNTEQQNFEG
jgi:hypothetical protein